jgi:hypothetical protein
MLEGKRCQDFPDETAFMNDKIVCR